ncbi:MAG: chaperone modulatory protein CbpM [Gammaproteobacteria bacterium]|jgi:chaperone modulatory protein CbpM
MVIEKGVLTGAVLDSESMFTLSDLSLACEVHAEWIIELVDEGILEPTGMGMGMSIAHWQFSGASLRRARTVRRLQHDLRINLAGAALALQLMDEIDGLEVRLRVFGRTG